MTSQRDMESNVEQEREIPVFTVVKNNAILKNIFLINSGSTISEAHRQDSTKTCQDSEQTLLVGRHPDCDIRLEHPSISRFHLRILAKPSSKRLFVTDLSSAHGTWISGKRIEPNIRVDVNEGDALRIGGSSRVYRLHWIPFHKAYDSNDPFAPPLDVPPPDEENEETKRDENALVMENGGLSVNFSSPEYILSNQFKTSGQMEDVNTLLSENEDEKSLELGCECSLDSALEAIKALVSNQFEASKEMLDENTQIIDEKTVDSPSEDLGLNPNFKPSQEAEVLSVAPPPEAMKALDMPLESSNMQFVNFSWEGSEILLLHGSPLPVALEENELSLTMQETVDYSHNMVAKYEGMPLVLKLEDNMSISRDTEEDGEKEGNISGSAGPLGKQAVNSLKENECEEEKDNINQQVEEETESLGDLLFSQESSLTEIQRESSSGPALTSNLMENLDVAISESIADETLVGNEKLIPSCDDEEMDDAWSFWSLSNQGLKSENASQVGNSFEDTSSGEIQSSLWTFWSGISEAKSVHSSSLSDGELPHVEIQSTSGSFCCIHSMETLRSKPSEERSPDRGQSATNLENKKNRTLQEKLDGISINNEAGMLNDGSGYDPLERALFIGTDTDSLDLEQGYFTPEKENYTRSTQVAKGKSGTSNKHLPSLEKPQVLITTAKACTNSENSLSAYSNKENMTPKVIPEQKSARHPSEEHTKSCILKKREMKRTPLRTLFADSPLKSVSEAHTSGGSMSAYSNMNKENQTPKALQEQKSARHSSAKSMKLSLPSKGEEQRMPSKTLFADSPQKNTSNCLTSGDATPSACSNKESQIPKFLQEQKSAGHTKLFLLRKQEAESIPFQTLFVDSPQKSISYTHISNVSARARNSTTCEDSIDKSKHSKLRVMRWTMLVDIASLLDKTSRKALQLLEGIKGTQLIIPRAVVNELDVMKQKPSFFKKNTEAYLASQWIEECAVRTKWWIQIQSSMDDDGISTALLPNSTSYCVYGTLPEKVSKSIDDHVIEYALYFRKIQNDGQLVLLSDDSTIKIKAMAEGLICESANEFRESLVNPFSKRFMWADSLPGGRTWSYLDDVIAMQKLYPGVMKTTLKGVQNVRGLKLLLFHDSIHQ